TASRPPESPWFELSPPFYWSVTAVTDFAFIIIEFDWTCPRAAETSRARSNRSVLVPHCKTDHALSTNVVNLTTDLICCSGYRGVSVVGALVVAAAISFLAPTTWNERLWPGWVCVVPIGALAVLAYYLTLYLHANISCSSRRMRGNATQGGLDAIP